MSLDRYSFDDLVNEVCRCMPSIGFSSSDLITYIEHGALRELSSDSSDSYSSSDLVHLLLCIEYVEDGLGFAEAVREVKALVRMESLLQLVHH